MWPPVPFPYPDHHNALYIYPSDCHRHETEPVRDIRFKNDRYRFDLVIGSGSFGLVCRVRDNESLECRALKIQHHGKLLPKEIDFYRELRDVERVPKLHDTFEEKEKFCMVFELLGFSLFDFAMVKDWRFSALEMFEIAVQMIECLEVLHEKKILHLDIKPDNFVYGIGPKKNVLHIIDFGLSAKFEDCAGNHRPQTAQFPRGSTAYMSRNTHLGITPSRRDDLESMAYSLLHLISGDLPWIGTSGSTFIKKNAKTLEMKKKEFLFGKFPLEFDVFLRKVLQLQYAERPDYELFKKLFTPMEFDRDRLSRQYFVEERTSVRILEPVQEKQKKLLLLFEKTDPKG